MPLLDIVELMYDAQLANEQFIIVRRIERVGENGRSNLEVHVGWATGQIAPQGANSLAREIDYQYMRNSFHVITPYPLIGPAKIKTTGMYFQPDIIVLQGDPHVVISLNDWMNFGRGFVEADITSMALTDEITTKLPPHWGQLDFSKPANSGLIPQARGEEWPSPLF
jgi:hypothetical protein